MSSEIYANVPAQDTKHGAIPVGQLLGYLARRNADGSNSLDDDFKVSFTEIFVHFTR